MKVYLGNNLGYRLQLISANQKKRFSAGWTPVSARKNVSFIFSLSFFFKFWALKKKLTLSCFQEVEKRKKTPKQNQKLKPNPAFLA